MYQYKAPLADMQFHLNADSADHETQLMVMQEAAKLAEQVLNPVNQLGDTIGCKFDGNSVRLPASQIEAFKTYAAGGWMGVAMAEQLGGQALPETLNTKVAEMITSANHSLSMMSALTMSAIKALDVFGSEALKQAYLPAMVAGQWTGTMCMTEAHCGSDLGLIKTLAKEASPNSVQSVAPEFACYQVTGQKIFISAGEHDAVDNIIHLVLARTEGAPQGTKGLSLFLVPKFLPDGAHNTLQCIGIEEKMGIHANPTCTMDFDRAIGFLVGELNQGMKAMFTMMNEMRLGTALQGVGLSEQAYQASRVYALDRRQGKALSRQKQSAEAADVLIRHADVKRMVLTQKAFAQGGRSLCHLCAELLDATNSSDPLIAKEAEPLLGLLTPIAKAFLTESGLESASLAIQVYGGHGFIREHGVEQIYRDGRIATLYEGTTGIQALDLLGRKVLGDQAQALLLFTKRIHRLCKQILNSEGEGESTDPRLRFMAERLLPYAKQWPTLAQTIGMKAMQDHDEVGAAATDFLMYSGYVALAYCWLSMAYQGHKRLNLEQPDQAFLEGKIKTARFYFDKLLPRADLHFSVIQQGKQALDDIDDENV